MTDRAPKIIRFSTPGAELPRWRSGSFNSAVGPEVVGGVQVVVDLEPSIRAAVYHCAACRIEQMTARACDVCAQPVMLGELFDAGPVAFVVVAGRWDDGARNTKLISEPLTLDAALVEYAACACYPWRQIEYKGVCLGVWEPGQ